MSDDLRHYLTNKGYPASIASDEELIAMYEDSEEHKKQANYRYISKSNRYYVLKRQRWVCNICGCKLKYSINNDWEGKVAHIDHIHPFSKRFNYINGVESINELSNLQALCPECNLSKSKKEIN